MLRFFRGNRGQSTAEYAILIGLVVAAALTMQTMVKRTFQARMKDSGDDFYDELTAEVATLDSTYTPIPGTLESKQFEPGMNSTDSAKSVRTRDVLATEPSYEAIQINPDTTTYTREVKDIVQATSPATEYREYEYSGN
ncbi:MAG: hypothetical protein KJ793_00775 [Candidatus Omnitrophica bacterium]|nr:hypothetical protein [Candidatus Omnitrophota bacterium]